MGTVRIFSEPNRAHPLHGTANDSIFINKNLQNQREGILL
jgi:hypothetical protein